MIRINQIKMPLHHNAAALEQKIRKRLGLSGGGNPLGNAVAVVNGISFAGISMFLQKIGRAHV